MSKLFIENTENITVSAVVVTYNRLDLLKQSIAALQNQHSASLKHIIIVNGASTDGTKDWVLAEAKKDTKIFFVDLPKNVGGAGGFNQGVRAFIQQTNDDFVWLMDDDSLVTDDALDRLLEVWKLDPTAGMAASHDIWKDGTWANMNMAAPLFSDKIKVYYGDAPFVRIKHSTFVSTIISRMAVLKVGLPQKEYFIWGDDIEYTQRVTHFFPGFFVRNSIVVHASGKNPLPGDISGEKVRARLPRYLNEFRNRLCTSKRRHSLPKYIKTLGHNAYDFVKVLLTPGVKFRFAKLGIIIKGTWNGFFFNPPIEYGDPEYEYRAEVMEKIWK
ncbi:MAG: glycosyltransferase family 2 protein [Oenococcus sp.]|uniref:glycosyltransferase family 2 protein n=1 Tax=Oenococcus TaxID=46254 RepID=UPI00031FAC19|nr:glycosyltransferase family 2 protein [Oenococcus kitaharae]MCV3297179.1 glycosyltransferase family 2 protein [Oenococcus kitaharae]OEY83188.1 glycosyl transferase [Oenococcus kitaharae]OEY84290.1 glycosyl transferase [Oenococcus kitaharae]OEY85868.1 glycosyl transferase [Oenococcus kitaharae]